MADPPLLGLQQQLQLTLFGSADGLWFEQAAAAPPSTTCMRWLPECLLCQWLFLCWIFHFLKMMSDECDGYIDPDETSAVGFDDENGEDS